MIRVVKAVGEVVVQIPDIPDVEIPPLRNHLQQMLDGMREGNAQSKEVGAKSKSGAKSGDRDTKAQAKSKSKDASTKSKSGSGDKDPKVKSKSKGEGSAKSESSSKSKSESVTPAKLGQKIWKRSRCL